MKIPRYSLLVLAWAGAVVGAAEPGETVGPAAVKYVNRLSDFLFVASRTANDRGRSDVLWVPGKNR